MKQMHCPHFVRMSGTQYYCMKGNFPVDCYKCNCTDKKEIEVTITTSSSFDCKDCTNRKGCIYCENGELHEYKPVAKKEAEGNLKRLIDEMTREELTNSKEYQISKAALDWFIANPKADDLDVIDGFEAGYEKAVNTMIVKACEWLENNLLEYWSQINANNVEDFIEKFKKAMEE